MPETQHEPHFFITATGRSYWDTDLPTINIETLIITTLWTEFLIKIFAKRQTYFPRKDKACQQLIVAFKWL